jgi:putative membrane protein
MPDILPVRVAEPASPGSARPGSPLDLRSVEASNGPATIGVIAILAVSASAIGFLLWLLYVHHAPAEFKHRLLFLPALNALLNGLSALSLVIGFRYILAGQITRHRAAMMTAFVFSSIFLVSYIINHAVHGDTRYPGHSTLRAVYLTILASHVLLSIVALPLVLITFFFSLSGRFRLHRNIARYTFPIWLYVSVTGVVVYLMLRAAR